MDDIYSILFFTIAAGACIPIGGFIASFERIQSKWLEQELRHFIIAFGGGILVGAVAVVLVPEGMEHMHHSMFAVPAFIIGGVVFFFVERALALNKRAAPQMMGMLLDFVPEAMALGGLMALDASAAPLLAVLIGLQNLPEGFNSYRELIAQNGNRTKNTLLKMTSLVLLGPLAGLSGYFFLSDHEMVLGGIMLFASGGILYLIFQDIAPQSRLHRHWGPPLGAVLGFSLAMFSEMLVSAA